MQEVSADSLLEQLAGGEAFGDSGKDQTLTRLALALADLSVNDLSIHFLGSSKFRSSEPYAALDELIQKSTKYYNCGMSECRSYYKFKAVPKLPILVFKEFVESDIEQLREIVLPATVKGAQATAQSYLEKCCRHYVQKQFSGFLAAPHEDQQVKSLSEVPHPNLRRYAQELDKVWADAFYLKFAKAKRAVAELYEHVVSLTMERDIIVCEQRSAGARGRPGN